MKEPILLVAGVALFFVVYAGVGALVHAVVIGPTFHFGSAWTWGLLLGWPVPIAAVVAALAAIAGLVTWAFLSWQGRR